jgi:hypothetical protein
MEETLERFAPLIDFEASLSGVSTKRIEGVIGADEGSDRWKMIVWMYASGAWREWEIKLKEKP